LQVRDVLRLGNPTLREVAALAADLADTLA